MNLKNKLASIALLGFFGLNLPFGHLAKANPQGNGPRSLGQRAEERREIMSFIGRRAVVGTGQVTAVSGTTLTVAKDGKSYTVLTDAKTQFRRRFWGKSSLSEIKVGDKINVIGRWTDESKTTIQATLIRDLSILKRRGSFFGEVTSLTATGFVIKTAKKDNLTVTILDSTKLVNRREQTIAKGDILVGHRVRVKGVWDANAKTITEATQVKDFSLPVGVTPTPTPTPTP